MTSQQLPSGARMLAERYPEVWSAYESLGRACGEAGPIEGQAQRLIKLALAMGRGSEGAVHSHTRRALEEGVPAEQVLHVALMAIPTLGLPGGVAALTWVMDIIEKTER